MKPATHIIALLAGGLLGCTVGFGCRWVEAGPVPFEVQAAVLDQQPLAVSAEDVKLFERVRPLVRREAEALLKAEADSLTDGTKSGIGAYFAAAVASYVWGIVKGMILGALLALAWKWALAQWPWVTAALVGHLFVTACIAEWRARANRGKP